MTNFYETVDQIRRAAQRAARLLDDPEWIRVSELANECLTALNEVLDAHRYHTLVTERAYDELIVRGACHTDQRVTIPATARFPSSPGSRRFRISRLRASGNA